MRVYDTHELRAAVTRALLDPAIVPPGALGALFTARTIDGIQAIFALKVGEGEWDMTIHRDHSFVEETSVSGLTVRGTWP